MAGRIEVKYRFMGERTEVRYWFMAERTEVLVYGRKN